MTNETIYHIIIPFLTLFLGFFFGNKLAIGRDKRKEFNEIIFPIRKILLDNIRMLESEHHFVRSVALEDFTCVEMLISKSKIARFRKAIAKYKTEEQNSGHFDQGHFIIDDLSGYIRASYELLKYMKVK